MTEPRLAPPVRVPPLWIGLALAGWGLAYAAYRGYYAAGGTAFVPGVPASESQFQALNAAAVVVLLVGAAVPVLALPLWRRRGWRIPLLVLCWVVAVGCTMHALVDMTERVLSLAGLLLVRYPASVWTSVDHRAADLQDLLGNEPWFLLEGLGFAALGWLALAPGRSRRRWLWTAGAAVAVLTTIGLLSATGVIGTAIVG